MTKKTKKSLLPKRIGGVKVPKALRKGRAGQFLTSPAGMALLAEGLAMAGAFRAVKKADGASEIGRLRDHPRAEFKRLKGKAGDAGGDSAEALRGAFAAASTAFAEALRGRAAALDDSPKKSGARAAH